MCTAFPSGTFCRSAIFGELCFCLKTRREQALALEASEVVELSFDRLLSHLQNSSEALTSFLSGISHHLSDAYEQIRPLSFDTRYQGRRFVRDGIKVCGHRPRRVGTGPVTGTRVLTALGVTASPPLSTPFRT